MAMPVSGGAAIRNAECGIGARGVSAVGDACQRGGMGDCVLRRLFAAAVWGIASCVACSRRRV